MAKQLSGLEDGQILASNGSLCVENEKNALKWNNTLGWSPSHLHVKMIREYHHVASHYIAAIFNTVNCVFKLQRLMTTHHNIRLILSLRAAFKGLLMIRIIWDMRHEWHPGSLQPILPIHPLGNLRYMYSHACQNNLRSILGGWELNEPLRPL